MANGADYSGISPLTLSYNPIPYLKIEFDPSKSAGICQTSNSGVYTEKFKIGVIKTEPMHSHNAETIVLGDMNSFFYQIITIDMPTTTSCCGCTFKTSLPEQEISSWPASTQTHTVTFDEYRDCYQCYTAFTTYTVEYDDESNEFDSASSSSSCPSLTGQ